jgi:hypothetical protein
MVGRRGSASYVAGSRWLGARRGGSPRAQVTGPICLSHGAVRRPVAGDDTEVVRTHGVQRSEELQVDSVSFFQVGFRLGCVVWLPGEHTIGLATVFLYRP